MENTFFFLVDFIIAQNLEKVKFWEGRGSLRTKWGGEERRKREGEKQSKIKKNGLCREGRRGGGLAMPFSNFCQEPLPQFLPVNI